jgi:PBSX family phage terminase large subunit
MTGPVLDREVRLRGAALNVMQERAPEVLLAGPAGTGKSFAVLWKIHLTCMLVPNVRVLVCRKTHKSLTSTGLVTFREQVATDAIAAKICRWYGGSGEKPAQYIYANGSVIVVGGLDQPDKVMSAEYDLAFIQEATDCTSDDWEKVSSRLRNGVLSYQALLADANPQQPSHWLKKRCDEGKTQMLYSRHEDNPRLYGEDPSTGSPRITPYGKAYMARLDALSGVRKERLRYGRWAAADGIIYGDWRPEIHLVDGRKLPASWTRIWSVDFGFTHPFVWQCWAIDPDGRMWLEKEIYRTQTLVEDHAKEILRVTKGMPSPRAVVCDHDAEDRATLERYLGMGTQAATKTVSDGIQAMAQRLRPAGDGLPRLFVLRDSLTSRDELLAETGRPLGFAQEIEGYVWEPDTKGVLAKDKPRKDEDDSMDAARYAVAYQDLKPRGTIRWL